MNAEVHTLAGAYALDALPSDEAAAFVDHLSRCETCRAEVAELRATATQLGLRAAQTPPPELRTRVLEAVHQTRQAAPIAARGGVVGGGHRSWPRVLAAAAALTVIVGTGVASVRSALDDADEPARQNPVAAVMNAPDARSETAPLRGGGSMTVVVSQRLDRAVVLAEDLPRLARSRVYQLWLVDPNGTARSADVLIRPHGTQRRSGLISGVRPGDRIAITREPAGGSEQPTTAPLAVVDQA